VVRSSSIQKRRLLSFFSPEVVETDEFEELASQIIDVVEGAIRHNKPEVDLIASKCEGNTLLHGEAYYDLENEVARRIREFAAIPVSRQKLYDCLASYLDREATEEEMEEFTSFVEVDVGQWLVDNAKSFVRQREREDEER